MTKYSIGVGTRKYVNGYELLSFAMNFSQIYRKQLLDSELDALKTTSKR